MQEPEKTGMTLGEAGSKLEAINQTCQQKQLRFFASLQLGVKAITARPFFDS